MLWGHFKAKPQIQELNAKKLNKNIMNYLKLYFSLVNSRKELERDCYTEKHHIIPKSIYGKGIMDESALSNVEDPKNIIQLTGREHFVAHWLLHRAFPRTRNFAAAFHAMASMSNKYHRRYTPSSRTIEEARIANRDSMQEAVAMYSLKGKLVRVFASTDDAVNELNIEKSNISAACSPNNKYVNNVKGFQWRRFIDKPLSHIEPYNNQNDDTSLKVHEYDIKGNFVNSYNSIREANRNGINRSSLKKEYRETPIFSKDRWYLVSQQQAPPTIIVKKVNTQRRSVHQIDTKTGEIIKTWKSTREPHKVLGISNVAEVCKGKRKTMGGFIWKYAEDEYNLELSNHIRKLTKAKKIFITKDDNDVGEFLSLRKAELETGISRTLLSKSLKNSIVIDGIKVFCS